MNCNELKNNLQDFQKTCYEEGYIYNNLTFDEAYPGVIPTPFMVNMVKQKSWELPTMGKALDKLIDILWDKTERETRKNVFTLNLYTIDEMVNSKRKKNRKQIAMNPDLTDEQIEKLYADKKKSVRDRVIIKRKEINVLTKKQIYSIFDIDNDITIKLLKERLAKDEYLKKFALEDEYLKFKMLQYTI